MEATDRGEVREEVRRFILRVNSLSRRIRHLHRLVESPPTAGARAANRALKHHLLRCHHYLGHVRHVLESAPLPTVTSITAVDCAAARRPRRRGQHLPSSDSPSDDLVIRVRDLVPRRPSLVIPAGLHLGSVLERERERKRKRKRKRGMKHRPTSPKHSRDHSYHLSPQTTVGELKAYLRRRYHPGREFLLLQPHEDGYPSALYHRNKTLAEYGVNSGDTLRMSSCHRFPLHIYDCSPVNPDHPFDPRHPTISPRDDRMILLHPSIYDTVATLKDIIYESTNYPPQTQLLNPISTEIHNKDHCTLQSLGFNCCPYQWHQIALVCSIVQPPPLPPSSITITVVPNFFHLSTTFAVDPNITVGHLRKVYLAVDNTYLFKLGTAVLEDAMTLSDCNVQDGDVINMCEAKVY